MRVVSKRGGSKKKEKKYYGKKKPWQTKQYGTFKLEEQFARDFLDKLGVNYKWQFEAKDIGRFFDFRILPKGPIIEVNGGYWHADPRLYEAKDLNLIQKKNIRVDETKRHWAISHGIPIYYIWEKDIHDNPSMVMKFLKEILHIDGGKRRDKPKE